MPDFSSLDLPIDIQENANVTIFAQEQVLIDEVEINSGDKEFLHINNPVKDTQVNPLLSSISNVLYPYIMIYGSDNT
ncbi:hypothetical protein, partial [Enterococcus casseliflavus]|uniref:hypothetical protein n=1 Tax=Enterococcus casseliflavus TaxID=37734 RepID=UPI0019D48832